MERLTKRDSKGNALPAKTSTSTFVGTIYEENKVLEQERLDRLAELEDKLESGQLLELPTIISFPDMHPILGKITTYQVIWLSELLGIRHEKYTTQEKAEARLKELQEKI